ncbi:cadherin domain-containing protein [Aliamphritea hakodatensis]|uniref:cadherin domain-containing protein n=1 Tax=Aliamphritea hakodatensis TaxID=2895352 RepID=UPI0022FD792A|nr:cadherin domain-containing protein [Aliamphritea hakodatensis]
MSQTEVTAALNFAPVAQNIASLSVDEDSVFTLPVADYFTDEDPGSLTFQVMLADGSPLPAWLTFDGATQVLSGIPENHDVGDVSLKVIATDNGGLTAENQFNIQIKNTNDAPVAVDDVLVPAESASRKNYTVQLKSDPGKPRFGDFWIEKQGDDTLVFWQGETNGSSIEWHYQKLATDVSVASEVKTFDLPHDSYLIRIYQENGKVKILTRQKGAESEPYEGRYSFYERTVNDDLTVSDRSYVAYQDRSIYFPNADTAEVVWSEGDRKGVLWEFSPDRNTYGYTVSDTQTLTQKSIYAGGGYGYIDDSVIRVSDNEVALLMGTNQSLSVQLINQNLGPDSSDSLSDYRYEIDYPELGLGYNEGYVFRLSDDRLMIIIDFGEGLFNEGREFLSQLYSYGSKTQFTNRQWSGSQLYYTVVNTADGIYSDLKRMSEFSDTQNIIDVDYVDNPGSGNAVFITFSEQNDQGLYEIKGRFISAIGEQIGDDLLLSAQPVNSYGVFIDDYYDAMHPWSGDPYPDAGEYAYNTIVRGDEVLSVWSSPGVLHVSSVSYAAKSSDRFEYNPLVNDYDPDSVNVPDTLELVSARILEGYGQVSVANGKVHYDASGAYDYLPDSESEQVLIEYTVRDSSGAESVATITADMNGQLDKASFDNYVVFNPSNKTDRVLSLSDRNDYISIDPSTFTDTSQRQSYTVNTGGGNNHIAFRSPRRYITLRRRIYRDFRVYSGKGSDSYSFSDILKNKYYISDLGGYNRLIFNTPYRFGIRPALNPSLSYGSLKITFAGMEGEIHLVNFDRDDVLGGHRDIHYFEFNGVGYTYEELVALGFDLKGDAGDNTIKGTSVVDRITGGAGNDHLAGGQGNDTYYFASGDGADTLSDSEGVNTIEITSEIATDALLFETEGDDLIIKLSATDSIRVTDWMTLRADAVARIVTNNGEITAQDIQAQLNAVTQLPTGPGRVTDSDSADNAVDENSPVGTKVGVTARAINADTYSLVDDAGGRFAIAPRTGEVTVAGSLNHEAADSHTIRVRASGAGGSAEEDFTIAVRDVNEPPVIIFDVAPGPLTDSDSADNAVDENSPVGTKTGVTARAINADTYSLVDDAGGRFAIDARTGEVTVAGSLNHEAADSHTIRVRASGAGGSAEEDFTIAVRDVNEPPVIIFDVASGPLTDSDSADNAVDENSPVGTKVGVTARALNADTYSLVDDAGGRFAIDPRTGEITVAGCLNYEAADSHTIRVRASSPGGSAEENFTIAVQDVNEPPVIIFDLAPGPLTDSDSADNAVDENSPVGTKTGVTARAINADTYSLVDDAGGRFSIDARTGEVTVAGNLNYEAADSHTIRVRASSPGGSAEEDFTIAVRDVNEPPQIIFFDEGGNRGANDADKGLEMSTDTGSDEGYYFARGDGQDVIAQADAAGHDTLIFDRDITADELWFSRHGEDLRISVVGTDDQVTVDDWYTGSDAQLDQIETDAAVLRHSQVNQLVNAMAAFAAPEGDGGVIPQPVRDTLQPVLAASWKSH